MSFWKSGPNHQTSGVAIFLKKDFEGKLQNIAHNNTGRILSIFFLLHKQLFQIINVYSPNKANHRKHYYQPLNKYTTNTHKIKPNLAKILIWL